MTTATDPEPGQKWVRYHRSYEILDVSDGIVTMHDRSRPESYPQPVEETLERFREEAEAGRLVLHLTCENCGLWIDPEEVWEGPLHYECWFEQATVRERCEAETNRAGGDIIASEALRSGDPREHLLGVIGDPARSFHDRVDAENFLTHAVSTREIIDASVRCSNCLEGEAFEMNPTTGEVRCHCGELLKEADDAEQSAGV